MALNVRALAKFGHGKILARSATPWQNLGEPAGEPLTRCYMMSLFMNSLVELIFDSLLLQILIAKNVLSLPFRGHMGYVCKCHD